MQLKCQYCGNIFNGDRESRKFCSRECKSLYLKGKPKSKNIREVVTNICQYCGKPFITRRSSQKYCNKECMNNFNKQLLHIINCPTCNEKFMPSRREQIFCCIKCSKPRKNEYFKNECIKCNEIFEARYNEDNTCFKCRVELKTDKCAQWHGKWCQYKDVKVMSTYELRVCNILDTMLEQNLIYKWGYDKDKIKYFGIDKKQHNYIVDFKVHINENEFYYLEVKGLQRPNDLLKWEATRKSGFNLDIWFLSDIENKEISLNINKEEIKYLLKMCIITKEAK